MRSAGHMTAGLIKGLLGHLFPVTINMIKNDDHMICLSYLEGHFYVNLILWFSCFRTCSCDTCFPWDLLSQESDLQANHCSFSVLVSLEHFGYSVYWDFSRDVILDVVQQLVARGMCSPWLVIKMVMHQKPPSDYFGGLPVVFPVCLQLSVTTGRAVVNLEKV